MYGIDDSTSSIKQGIIIPDALLNITNPMIKSQLKKFCKENNLCVACSYINPKHPTVLVLNQLVYECPNCDFDIEYS